MKYTIKYKDYQFDNPKSIEVEARSKCSAYDTAVHELLQGRPYSAWVEGVTLRDGRYKELNTFEGKPF